ncbi:lipase family protein [Mycobacterium simiae]|uniref:Lipase n=1 Tax=Mycobacterium simiae TaxID=1784 RepID=A0A1X0YI62_MYCSI|nr:lipase family protein [Mycobacterium simiae]ORJ64884.1 hypothetical protein B5M45_01110 [Mycobacterium simiae]
MTMLKPEDDLFYNFPLCGENHCPGELLRARNVEIETATPCSASQVVYVSTGARGQRIAVSGTLLRPTVGWRGPGPRPIISYGMGVHGLSRNVAPSYLMRLGKEIEVALLDQALARGWNVAVTDGDGLGMPGPHTYGAGRPGGHAMLDIVRAAAHSDLMRDDASFPVALWGYSEGGRCAAWAAELQPTYAPELDLRAVAAGGVPADLYKMARAIDGGQFSGLGLAVVVGLMHAYDDPALGRVLNARGRAAAESAARMDVTKLIREHPEEIRRHTVRDEPWDEPVWRSLLEQERNGRIGPKVPVYLYHLEDDQLVPTEQARALHANYVALGVDVTWTTVRADNHLAGAFEGAPHALWWLNQRLGIPRWGAAAENSARTPQGSTRPDQAGGHLLIE